MIRFWNSENQTRRNDYEINEVGDINNYVQPTLDKTSKNHIRNPDLDSASIGHLKIDHKVEVALGHVFSI